jgi:hypothetical protein
MRLRSFRRRSIESKNKGRGRDCPQPQERMSRLKKRKRRMKMSYNNFELIILIISLYSISNLSCTYRGENIEGTRRRIISISVF